MSENAANPPTTALSRDPELLQAERAIERTRERVSQSMNALRAAVSKRTDWREWVREQPGLFVAVAFGLGMFWGLRSGRRSGSSGNR